MRRPHGLVSAALVLVLGPAFLSIHTLSLARAAMAQAPAPASTEPAATSPAATLPARSGGGIPRPDLAQGGPQQGLPNAKCTFSNASFSGKCIEIAPMPAGSSPRKACGEILDCLNDSMCIKTYCQATEIRGGWKIDSAVPAR